jgi:hypothetical protein
MTIEFETGLVAAIDALDNLHDQSDGMRALEIIFSLESIAGKVNEMICDMQCDTAMHTNGRQFTNRNNDGSA